MEASRKAGQASVGPLIFVSGATRTAWTPGGRLYTPRSRNAITPSEPWALDNGAFAGFDAASFTRYVEHVADRRGWSGCRFVALPDVVADWAATIRLSLGWIARVRQLGAPVAIVAQDGVTVGGYPWHLVDAVFLGGSTAWKLGPVAADLSAYGRALGKWVHMGRVNTRQRLRYAGELGCHSVDGTLFSRWPDEGARRATRWRAQIQASPRFDWS